MANESDKSVAEDQLYAHDPWATGGVLGAAAFPQAAPTPAIARSAACPPEETIATLKREKTDMLDKANLLGKTIAKLSREKTDMLTETDLLNKMNEKLTQEKTDALLELDLIKRTNVAESEIAAAPALSASAQEFMHLMDKAGLLSCTLEQQEALIASLALRQSEMREVSMVELQRVRSEVSTQMRQLNEATVEQQEALFASLAQRQTVMREEAKFELHSVRDAVQAELHGTIPNYLDAAMDGLLARLNRSFESAPAAAAPSLSLPPSRSFSSPRLKKIDEEKKLAREKFEQEEYAQAKFEQEKNEEKHEQEKYEQANNKANIYIPPYPFPHPQPSAMQRDHALSQDFEKVKMEVKVNLQKVRLLGGEERAGEE